jgi:histidinol-phosphate aminotransferase
MSIENFIQPHLKTTEGYQTHRSPDTLGGKTEVAVDDIIKLDANENVYGCSPRVQAALGNFTKFNIYPDAEQTELRKALSGYTGTPADTIVLGNGSGELLDYVLHLFVGPGDEVINFVPTFDLYRTRTERLNGKLIDIERNADFAIDVSRIMTAITPKTKLVIVTNPNNPDGTLTPEKDIRAILETGRPVLVDEAYYEFSNVTVVPLMQKYENLMILRTFSKWTGLAGLRVGYGLFPPVIAAYLLKNKLPYNVSCAAQVAVLESLKDTEYLMGTVRKIIAERERLLKELEKITYLKPYPSRANYVLCRVGNNRAGDLRERMQGKGILVRFWDRPLMRDFIRISVGRPEHTDAVIKVLKEMGG